jgi:Clr5 domain
MADRQTKARSALGQAGPVRSATAHAHPTAVEWNHHRERIVDLYIGQGEKLKDVAQTMLDEHGFYAT